MMFSLQCWIKDDPIQNIFFVEISRNDTVARLKEAIKKKASVRFRDVDAMDLNLYSIPNPDDADLEAVLENWHSKGKNRLNGRHKVSTLFRDGDDSELLIIVDGPRAGPPDITLICWIRGPDSKAMFTVEISPTKLVGTLKNAIKDSNPEHFRHVNVTDLVLYKVCHPLDDGVEAIMEGEKLVLHLSKALSDYFPEVPPEDHIHVVVDGPLPTHSLTVSLSVNPRLQYIQKWTCSPSKSPSEQGEPSNFNHLQSTERKIEWTRPSVGSLTIPVALLHPIFGEFAHNCYNHEPTSEDNRLVLDLCCQMSKFFKEEAGRQEAILDILREYGIGMVSSSFTRYSTDGDLHVNGRRYAILEVKNEIGSKGAEPYCQAIIYYILAIKGMVEKAHEDGVLFNFPCLLITLFGPHLSFSGVVWADRPNCQVLSTSLPLFSPPTDRMMRRSIGRHIGAFRKACDALKALYENFAANPAAFRDLQPEFPHPRSYTSSDGNRVEFTYVRVLEAGKLLFVVETTGTGKRLCVKFAQTYSVDVHQYCVDIGISPLLWAHTVIPGGWYMIVMDFLEDWDCLHRAKRDLSGEDKGRLRQEFESTLTKLHQKNYVHGDVRDANVMVTKDRSGWKLIDFDWSGKIGEVRYPMNVNRRGLQRPDGAIDGELILADHDIKMLEYLF